MSLKKLSGETFVYGLSNVLGRLLTFVLLTPFITEVTASEEFGQIGDLMFWTAFLIAGLTLRMDTAVFRFASRPEFSERGVFRRAQSMVVGLTVAVVGIMLLFAQPLADLMEYPDSTVYIWLVLLTVAFDVLSAVPLARLRLDGRAWFFVVVNLGNVFVNIVLVFFLLYFLADFESGLLGVAYNETFKVGYFLVAMMAAAGFRYLLLLVDGLRRYRVADTAPLDAPHPRTRPATEVPTYRKMLAYSLPLTIVAMAGIVNSLVGPTILKWWFGGDVTDNLYWSGQFTAALRLAVFLNLFVTAYNYAAEPFFFKQAGKDLKTADRTIYADALRAYGLVATLASAGILLFLPWIQLFLDEGEREGLFVLPLLLVANTLLGFYYNFAIAYKLTDRTSLGAIISSIGAAIAVGGTILFAETYGIYAPAAAMLACYAVMSLLAYLVTRKYFPVAYPLGRISVYVLLAVTAYYAGGLNDHFLFRCLVMLVLLGTVFLFERRWLRLTFFGG